MNGSVTRAAAAAAAATLVMMDAPSLRSSATRACRRHKLIDLMRAATGERGAPFPHGAAGSLPGCQVPVGS